MKSKHHFAILLGGDVTPTARLFQQIAGARVIAADSGMKHAAALGLTPELWVGDFDSSMPDLQAAYATVPRESYPTNKAVTDGAIAIEAALARGAQHMVLVGASGGQFDHALAHGTQLLDLSQRRTACFATSGHEEIHPLLHDLKLPDLPLGTRLSIVGLSTLEGLSISGVRWPLQHRNVPCGSTLTLSNETMGKVSITLELGMALVMAYPAGSTAN